MGDLRRLVSGPGGGLIAILLFGPSACQPDGLDGSASSTAGQGGQAVATPTTPQAAPTMSLQILDSAGVEGPWGKSAGDVDGDGDVDLLVQTNGFGAGLVWYRNPDWQRFQISGGSGFRTDMEVADIDLDGRADVVSIASNGLVWFGQPASGAETPGWTSHPISSATLHDVEVADLDGDGDADAVARDQSAFGGGPADVVMFRRDGSGWTSFTLGAPDGEGLHVTDLDGDGDKDIAVNEVWFENPGSISAGWASHTYTTSWTHGNAFVASGDLNGDGRRDIVLSPAEVAGDTYRTSWFEAPADATALWTEHIVEPSVETVVHSVGVGDFDRDGRQDIVTAEMSQSNGPDEVAMHLNGSSGWQKHVFSTEGSHSMRVVDVDSDGDPDVFGADWAAGEADGPVRLWINEASGPPPTLSLDDWETHILDSNKPDTSLFVSAGDIDGDGLPDIATDALWYRNPGSVSGSWARTPLGGAASNALAMYDFDADGDLDVFASDGFSANFAWVRNDGGSLTTLTNIESGIGDFLQGIAIADFSGGGRPQIALSWHAAGSGVQLLEVPTDPSAQTWTRSTIHPESQDEALSAGDIDADGDPDLFQGTSWLRNDGGTWTRFVVNATSFTPDRNRLVDMDGDGDLDAVVGFEQDPSDVVWLERPPDPTALWPTHVIGSNVGGGYALDVGDLDGDGDLDVVLGEHMGDTRVLIFENRGALPWSPHVVHPGGSNFDHHDGTRLFDIDLDGDFDILSIGWFNPEYLWVFENKAIDGGGGPINQAPTVDAGPNQVITEPVDTAALAATVADDGLPSGTLDVSWSLVGGPGSAVFSNASAAATDVTFDAFGIYTLRVSADDGALVVSDTTTVEYRSMADPPPATGLVAYWRLDETAGTFAADASGNGHHGTLQGTAPDVGRIDGGQRFDGSDALVAGSFDVIGEALTLAAWVKADGFLSPSFDNRIISKAESTSEQDHLWMLSTIEDAGDAVLRFRLNAGGSTSTLFASSGVLQTDQWHHAAAVYDGAQMQLYLDGVAVGSQAKSGTLGTDPSMAVNVGRNPDGYGTFDGVLDEVRVYDVALTAGEILALAQGQTGGGTTGAGGTTSAGGDGSTGPSPTTGVAATSGGSTSGAATSDPTASGGGTTAGPATTGGPAGTTGTSATSGGPPTATLVAHWTLDETSGSVAADASGNGNTGSLVGTTPDLGQIGGGHRFDAGDYMHAGFIDVSGAALTLSAWINADGFLDPHKDNRIVAKSDSTSEDDHYWMLSSIDVDGEAHLRFRLKTDGTTDTLVAGSGPIAVGQWHHAAAVYDGTAMTLYLDGAEVGSQPKTGAISTDPSIAVNVGRNPDGYGSWEGVLDDVRIYDAAVLPGELVQGYAEQRAAQRAGCECSANRPTTRGVPLWVMSIALLALRRKRRAAGVLTTIS